MKLPAILYLDHGPAGVNDVLDDDNVCPVQLPNVLDALDANGARSPGLNLDEV